MSRFGRIGDCGVLALALGAAAALAAAAAQQNGPISPPAPPVIRYIPLHPSVPPPKLPVEQIVSRFTANEAECKAAYDKYGFLETIRVDELASTDGGPGGSEEVQVETFVKPNGERYARILRQSGSSLAFLHLAPQDLVTLTEMPLFPLAGNAAADYDFDYRGTQKLDELTTYIFRVEPKTVVPGHPYFSGVVWVDNEDLAIVKSYGEFLLGEPRPANALPFRFFDTYRVNTVGNLWFPAYLRSDDVLKVGKNQVPIRLIIQAKDFHPGQPVLPAPGPARPAP